MVVYGMGDKNVYVVNVCFEFAFLVREFTVILILTAAFGIILDHSFILIYFHSLWFFNIV